MSNQYAITGTSASYDLSLKVNGEYLTFLEEGIGFVLLKEGCPLFVVQIIDDLCIQEECKNKIFSKNQRWVFVEREFVDKLVFRMNNQ